MAINDANPKDSISPASPPGRRPNIATPPDPKVKIVPITEAPEINPKFRADCHFTAKLFYGQAVDFMEPQKPLQKGWMVLKN